MKLFTLDIPGNVVHYNEITAVDSHIVPFSLESCRFDGTYDVAIHGRYPQQLEDLLVAEGKRLRFVMRVVSGDLYYVVDESGARKFVGNKLIPVSIKEVIPHLNHSRAHPFVFDYVERLTKMLDLISFTERSGLPSDISQAILD